MRTILIWLILNCLAMPGLAAAYTIDVTVEANKTKVNEAPWDGITGTGAGKGSLFFGVPTSGPPDLAICIIIVGKKNDCKLNLNGDKWSSLCQNSFDCDFHNIEITENVFAVLVLDLDSLHQDLVDMVILINAPSENLDGIDELEEAVRTVAEKVAPALTPGERQRRQRPLQQFELEQCSGSLECALRQSVLRAVK